MNRYSFLLPMRCKKKILVCLLPGLVYMPLLFAQYKMDQPVIITKAQGLPTNEVRSFRKGKDGFIWLATAKGLCRFDGQQVKTFTGDGDSTAAPFDDIVSAVLPLDGEVWIGTSQGISVLNIATETFRNYQFGDSSKTDSIKRRFDQNVTILYKDRQGRIWIGTRDKGVWVYDQQKDDFKRITYPSSAYRPIIPFLATNNTILSIEESQTNDSIIWMGTPSGLEEVNKYTGNVNWYTYAKEDKDYQVSVNVFRRLYAHDDGLLYVGSWLAGVSVFDPVKKTFTPLEIKNDLGKEILNSSIASILKKSRDELWITTGRGLVVYDIRQKTVTWARANVPLAYEFYGIDYIDEVNRFWLATINGIQYFDPVVQQFSESSFKHLYASDWLFIFYIIPDKSGDTLTVCPRITNALYRFDKKSGQWTSLPFNGLKEAGYDHVTARGFAEVRPGQYLISSDENLFYYSVAAKKISIVPHQPVLPFKRWGDLLKDHDNNIWLSADADGLVKWNLTTGQYRIFKKELTNDRSGVGFGRLLHKFEDSHHNIWFSRIDGFSVYVAAQDSIINFMYTENPDNSFPVIADFEEDRNGRIWATASDGHYGYIDVNTPGRGIVKKFDLKERNIEGSFVSLARDPKGNVWSYTGKDLVRINADDLSFSTFSFDYGVKNPEFFHFSFLPDNRMVFGGRNSITFADPAELERNTELPEPYIVQLKIINKPANHALYTDSSSLDLGYRQNFISIAFSAKAYTMPAGVRFRYRLKGFDNWVEAGRSRLANYTNIPPGDYTFQLQAANNEGIWNKNMLELPIHIATPWWLTLWFRIAALLAVAAIVYWFYQYRIDQVKKKEKLKSQYEKKLANVEMTALLAQMNPHFLFNSLNSIDSYIIKNESGKASEYLNNFARLMRLILQNSRSNYISLKDELEALDLYLQMERLRFGNKFEYEINVSEEIDISAIVIPPMLIQPYVENAIWHGLMHQANGTPGKVQILISQQMNNLVCVVQDNGIGRRKAQELKEQKPGNRKRSMGMQITRDRIEMINKLYNTNTSVKIVDLKDGEGNAAGTLVKLVIPF